MKALITGANGFVGKYLASELKKNGYEVYGIDIVATDNVYCVDILDYSALKDVIDKENPDCIFHLAGQASVGLSWSEPQMTFDVNVKGTLNLLEAVRKQEKRIKMLIIGSSDEYGKVKEEDCPISEELEPQPCNPYAISKLTQEELCRLYVKTHDMYIIMTRSFNHTGPGQKRGFVIADICSRIVSLEKSGEKRMPVGNLDAKRDFSDVRDIVRAYRLLMEDGIAGEIYNVGSGKAYSIKQMLDMLLDMSNKDIEVFVDKSKLRPIDLPLIQSDISKLSNCTGYHPKYDIKDTLSDVLEYWRSI